MIPILVVTSAWAEGVGFSSADIASVFDLDLQSAVPALDGQRCPQCNRDPVDSAIKLFVPESATATPERVEGRETVQCLCGTTYWYAAVHALDVRDPIGAARVCAASVSLRPGTGALQIEGQEPVQEIASSDNLTIHVHENVVSPGPATAQGGTCGPTVVIA